VNRNSYCTADDESYHAYVGCGFGFSEYTCIEGNHGLSTTISQCPNEGLIKNSGGCIVAWDPVCEELQAWIKFQGKKKSQCNYTFEPVWTNCENSYGIGTCNESWGCEVPLTGCQEDSDCEQFECQIGTCDAYSNIEWWIIPGSGWWGVLWWHGVCNYVPTEVCSPTNCEPDPEFKCDPCQIAVCNETNAVFECVDKIAPECLDCAEQVCDTDTNEFTCIPIDQDNDWIHSCIDCDDDDPAVAECSLCGNSIIDAWEECDGTANCDAITCECEQGYVANGGECFEVIDCEGDVTAWAIAWWFDLWFTCEIPVGAVLAPGQEYEFFLEFADGSTDSFIQAWSTVTYTSLGINDPSELNSFECSLTQSELVCEYPIIPSDTAPICNPSINWNEYIVFNPNDFPLCTSGVPANQIVDLNIYPWEYNRECVDWSGTLDCWVFIYPPYAIECIAV